MFAVAAAEVAAAVAGSLLSGRSYAEVLDSFVPLNATMGFAFAACGLLVAWHRPGNAIGWLLLADGLGHATTAGTASLVLYGGAGWPMPLVRVLATVGAYAWPWSIGLFLPLILQLFPDGRPAGPVLRWLAWATVATAPLFVLEMGAGPQALITGLTGYLTLPGYHGLEPLWLVTDLRVAAVALIGLVALVIRYRRGDEVLRRQLLWPLQAALLVVLVLVVWGVFEAGPVYQLLAVPLIPAAVVVAILRHQLLDIRLVFSRTVLYTLLTGAVMLAYVSLVAVLDTVVRQRAGPGNSITATVLIAIGFNPLRVRLQRGVDRILYGDRADPVRAVSRVGERLGAGLPGVLEAVREALRMPYAALRTTAPEGHAPQDGHGTVAVSGTAPQSLQSLHAIPLVYGDERVGELVVGLRRGESRLAAADRAILELLATPLSVAVRALALSRQLQHSREALVMAREEERRRLRRDLHDGLGPVLTGVTFKADAASNLIAADPEAARGLVAELRAETAGAINDIRRLVYDLRPPALDDLGLVGAIRQRAAHLQRDGVAIHVAAPAALPALPAAVEAAAFRIVTEAMTNAVRHARAGSIHVRLDAGTELRLRVSDDGVSPREWRPGVGLSSMRERAAELGGSCTAGPGAGGGEVVAILPLGAS
ncbi:two-component sensor histidine kinase [Nonomuraea turkmeniaca]|uniref:Two-component sensor histidine kinase n=2 Tax=Nonomuraea turkmeniaca TaxID=103838 RepID=A0A5S4FIM4_9ACTN|nr:two-component sensor histidine kinase [Nonomuraea turkmeniaca]